MKLRSTLLLGAAILAVTCSSCVKDFTCQCKIKYTGNPSLPDSLIREYPIKDTKDKAKSLCEANSAHSTDQNTNIKTDEDCKLF